MTIMHNYPKFTHQYEINMAIVKDAILKGEIFEDALIDLRWLCFQFGLYYVRLASNYNHLHHLTTTNSFHRFPFNRKSSCCGVVAISTEKFLVQILKLLSNHSKYMVM